MKFLMGLICVGTGLILANVGSVKDVQTVHELKKAPTGVYKLHTEIREGIEGSFSISDPTGSVGGYGCEAIACDGSGIATIQKSGVNYSIIRFQRTEIARTFPIISWEAKLSGDCAEAIIDGQRVCVFVKYDRKATHIQFDDRKSKWVAINKK